MRKLRSYLQIAAFAALVFSCVPEANSPWDADDAWYRTGKEVNPDYADVLYFVSTDIMHSETADGSTTYRAVLSDGEKALLDREFAHMQNKVFRDSLNFFAPYYHQMTFESFFLSAGEWKPVADATYDECFDAFQYYMDNVNSGRPYILAGFSQGAMVVKEILKRMSAEQYAGMVAAYVIGFELTEEDIESPYIIPATGAYDRGVTISYNSVCSLDSVWPLVCTNPAACINPVNWCTDSTPAPLQVGDISVSVALDTDNQIVVVTGFGDNPPERDFEEPWPKGNLHGQEIIIYADHLGRNALDRAYR